MLVPLQEKQFFLSTVELVLNTILILLNLIFSIFSNNKSQVSNNIVMWMIFKKFLFRPHLMIFISVLVCSKSAHCLNPFWEIWVRVFYNAVVHNVNCSVFSFAFQFPILFLMYEKHLGLWKTSEKWWIENETAELRKIFFERSMEIKLPETFHSLPGAIVESLRKLLDYKQLTLFN